MKFLKLSILVLLLNVTSYEKDLNINETNINQEVSSFSTSNLKKQINYTTDKEILIPVILNAQWRDFNSIVDMSDNDIRNTLIVELNNIEPMKVFHTYKHNLIWNYLFIAYYTLF